MPFFKLLFLFFLWRTLAIVLKLLKDAVWRDVVYNSIWADQYCRGEHHKRCRQKRKRQNSNDRDHWPTYVQRSSFISEQLKAGGNSICLCLTKVLLWTPRRPPCKDSLHTPSWFISYRRLAPKFSVCRYSVYINWMKLLRKGILE
jgi:hypothetical protein